MKKENIKVVISDLDGTLLNKHHQLSTFTKDVIAELSKTDIAFWIATGRHHCDAQNIRKKLGIDCVVISSNGATVANEDGELIVQETIERRIVEGILDIPIQEGVFQNLYQGSQWLMETYDKVFDAYYEEGDFAYTLCRFKDKLDQPINKIFFTSFDHEKLVPIYNDIKKTFGHGVEVTFSMPECLEVMPKGINKGVAIQKALLQYGFLPEEAIAFGDGLNDLEMLGVVGKGFIMENANPLLKEKLAHLDVIGSNADDSVAQFIQELFDIKVRVSA